jgi:threonine/homoserine/homoserine lactone efflux protein
MELLWSENAMIEGIGAVPIFQPTVREAAMRRPSVQRAVNRVGGSLLIGAGILTATWRRAAT